VTSREYLLHLEMHGIKLGLDNIRFLLNAADAPHLRYPIVHIAGTNGKGSVSALLAAIARAAGYRVARFTSPHLIDVTERFLLNGDPMSDSAFNENIEFFRRVAERMTPPPTFFEMNTAIAFRWFSQIHADLAIIEVGMGGRLDSTNIVNPLAAAITNIALDHTQYLGETIEKIAFEKAGIIKPGVPLILTETDDDARGVILNRAKELGAPTHSLGAEFQYDITGPAFRQQYQHKSKKLNIGPTPLRLAGRHQGANAAAAVELAQQIRADLPRIDERAIIEGLGSARWPCRLEKVLDAPPVIIDSAHNPAGARQIAKALPACTVLIAASADKDIAGIIGALAPITRELILTQYTGQRSAAVQTLKTAANRPAFLEPRLTDAIDLGLSLASQTKPLLITGSIFTAGEARQILTNHYGAPMLTF
jgi:dihydrofolate synthase/folylpolyglutamate synthase